MTTVPNRNEILPGTDVLAETLDQNFASIWSVIDGHIGGDNIEALSINAGHMRPSSITAANSALAENSVLAKNIAARNVTMRNRATDSILPPGTSSGGSVWANAGQWYTVPGCQTVYTSPSDSAVWLRMSGQVCVTHSGEGFHMMEARIIGVRSSDGYVEEWGHVMFSKNGNGGMAMSTMVNAMKALNPNDTWTIALQVLQQTGGQQYLISYVSTWNNLIVEIHPR